MQERDPTVCSAGMHQAPAAVVEPAAAAGTATSAAAAAQEKRALRQL